MFFQREAGMRAGLLFFMNRLILIVILSTIVVSCKKKAGVGQPADNTFSVLSVQIDGSSATSPTSVSRRPLIRVRFSAPVDPTTTGNNIHLTDMGSGGLAPLTAGNLQNNDSILEIQPSIALQGLARYSLSIATGLRSRQTMALSASFSRSFVTTIDSTDKFSRISDSVLLDLVQSQTLKYFWDFGHPVSGMARERSTSGDVVTTGGTGFGVMAMIAGINRNFISRAQGLSRIAQIVAFLSGKTTHYHGAFAHWINGASGVTVPFSTQDDGGDIVETSYLMQGLLTARQYFNSTTDNAEIQLRNDINNLWNAVDYSWYRQGGKNILYWNWSPDYDWAVNVPVRGWNEALITYVLAASAATNPIPKLTYDSGWAGNGSISNGNIYYGVRLTLGLPQGGPLFFSHYSFLGLDPHGLQDKYADYWTQDTAHTRINYTYCVANPQGFNGYSRDCWGLTASDDNASGYAAHSPANDLGVIAPTAAVSSIPYATDASMRAIRFFYYTLGDKLWGPYGFKDAFNLTNPWFDADYLAIDQGPQVVMIENYRSGLLWNLFMSCPEVQAGLKNLGFSSPHF